MGHTSIEIRKTLRALDTEMLTMDSDLSKLIYSNISAAQNNDIKDKIWYLQNKNGARGRSNI
jgi:hypothetical protein|tara:strand:+ start:374 stop:559 length:186 start_codon:yes stop_codon:yes gene_type:complete